LLFHFHEALVEAGPKLGNISKQRLDGREKRAPRRNARADRQD